MHGLEEKEVGYIAGTPYAGVEVRMKAGPGDGHRGEFTAWDIKAGKKVWSINEKFPVWSGVLATAGDVVFYGTMDGWFKAVDAKTGWQFKTSSGIIGQPTLQKERTRYRGVKQGKTIALQNAGATDIGLLLLEPLPGSNNVIILRFHVIYRNARGNYQGDGRSRRRKYQGLFRKRSQLDTRRNRTASNPHTPHCRRSRARHRRIVDDEPTPLEL